MACCRRAASLAARRRRAGRAVRPMLGRDHVLCAAVVRQLRPAVSPSDGRDAVCADCARERRSWDRARAVLRYDKHSRRLVLALQARRPDPCWPRASARWMQRAGARNAGRRRSAGAGAAALDPAVSARRYNQAALLAQAIRAAGGPPVAADWLVRRRRTPSQGQLGPAARARNVRGAFRPARRRSVRRQAGGRRRRRADDRAPRSRNAPAC